MAGNKKEPIIVALARLIAETFDELKGRSIAVSEVEPFSDKTNIPTLPLAIVALVNETGDQNPNGSGRISLTQDIMVEFAFKPTKYQRQDGKDTPFFAYYDFEGIRDRLLMATKNWRTPRNGGISYKGAEVESDEYAVYLAFRFTASEQWCEPADQPVPPPIDIAFKVLSAPGRCPPPDCPEPVDPCDFARERNPFGINDEPYDYKG